MFREISAKFVLAEFHTAVSGIFTMGVGGCTIANVPSYNNSKWQIQISMLKPGAFCGVIKILKQTQASLLIQSQAGVGAGL